MEGLGGRGVGKTSDELHEEKCLKWQQKYMGRLVFPIFSNYHPLIDKFEWMCATEHAEETFSIAQLRLREFFFFFFLIFDFFCPDLFVSCSCLLIMYSTGGVCDLMFCYTVLFVSSEREDISSPLTYSYVEGRIGLALCHYCCRFSSHSVVQDRFY